MACIAPEGLHHGVAGPQLLSGGLGVPGAAPAALFDPFFDPCVLAKASTQVTRQMLLRPTFGMVLVESVSTTTLLRELLP
jgi:hypothetical protein